ncbi:MAG: UDP-N-acetylmuramoyl-tripeptide--D-alanyl-D-alanine ligase [Candidatus Omnitrophica bacterium]|nr:UDP-N-acetylmuramoyl-tripeptide--D-alanyl-D-alanine ligase [Candidatus Omnitrophota bacterium]
MAAWTVQQLLEATEGVLYRGGPCGDVAGISIDSRRLQPGEAYVAIQGKRLDGHEFIQEAAYRGASCVIASREPQLTNGASTVPVIMVDDTTEALGDLARYHRRRLRVPVVAVTGSCGKTTTKDLIAHLLGEPETILKTHGSQNNHIGVPLTMLRLAPQHQMAVLELGSNHPGEIAYLASIAEPDVAVVTNVGPAHLEFFGSLIEVMREKLSLCEAVPPEGTAVIPGDQLDVCLEVPRRVDPNVRVVSFGTTDRCDIQATDIQPSDERMAVRLRDRLEPWTMPLAGYHNVENMLAAVACAWALGVPLSAARQRLASFRASPMRSEIVRCNGLTVLNDCYNANPLSVARALEMLRDLDVRRRLAIVGDMLELGEYAPAAHQAIGRLATQLGIDTIMAVGDYADWVAQGVREVRPDGVKTYRTVQELLAQLPGLLQHGDGLLVKGSRKLNLEQVTDFVLRQYQRTDGERAG